MIFKDRERATKTERGGMKGEKEKKECVDREET